MKNALLISFLLIIVATLNAQFTANVTNVGCYYGICNGTATIVPAGNYRYLWENNDTTATVSSLCPGPHYCSVYDSAMILLQPVTVEIPQPDLMDMNVVVFEAFCGSVNGDDGSIVVRPIPEYGTPPYTYIWSNGVAGDSIFGPPGEYSVTVTDGNGCTDTITSTIRNNNIDTSVLVQSLCVIATDTALMHHVIIWDKAYKYATDSFYIYRSTLPDSTYELIASISRDSISEYEDTGSLADQFAYRYKLSLKDTCGNHNALSPYHQTIYLQSLGAGQFSWTPYIIENDTTAPGSGSFYRDASGSGNWQLLQNLNNAQTTVNDPDFRSYPDARYMIVFTLMNACNPTRSITTVTSNILSHVNTGNAVENISDRAFTIFPNPAHDRVTISATGINGIYVNDVLGNHVYQVILHQNSVDISLSQLSAGIYFYTVQTDRRSYSGKLIKQ